MKPLVPLLIVSLTLALGVRAQDLAAVSSGVTSDLQKALTDLAEALRHR